MLVNRGANETHFPLNTLGMCLRGMPKGQGLAGEYVFDTESNFRPDCSIHISGT